MSENGTGTLGFVQSLKGRLLLICLGLSLVPLLAVGIFAFWRSQDALRVAAYGTLEKVVDVQHLALERWIDDRLADMKAFAGSEEARSMDPARAAEYMASLAAANSVYETLFLTGPDGVTLVTTDGETYDLRDRDYIKKALAGEASVSDAFVSKATGNVVLAVAAPVMDKGRVVGAASGTVSMASVAQLLEGSQLGQTGEAYLVNADGYLITPSRFEADLKREGLIRERTEFELRADTLAVREALRGREGVGEYVDYQSDPVLGAYAPIDIHGLNWALVAEMDIAEALAEGTALRNTLLIFAVVAVALVALIAFWLARSVSDPIVKMTEVAWEVARGDVSRDFELRRQDELGQMADAFRRMIGYQRNIAAAATRIADGDLSVRVTPQSERDVLAKAFQGMIGRLSDVMRTVQQSALQVASASQQIYAAAEQSAQASQQVAATIQQVASGTTTQTEALEEARHHVDAVIEAVDGIAKGAEEQARAVERMTAGVAEISAAITQVGQNAQAGTEAGDATGRTARAGVEAVDETIASMRRIRETVGEVGNKVQQMQEHSERIGEIVATIDDIAEQTNLLALNAAIEAARAGEQGRGFAVVADEVRKLAERSGAATKQIAELIGTVQRSISEAVTAMGESVQQVDTGSELAAQAGKSLEEILAASEEVVRQIAEIVQAVERVEGSSEELVSASESVSAIVEENTAASQECAQRGGQVTSGMDSVASVSEENSAAAEEVSAMAEELSAQAEEATASSQSLSELAENLQDILSQFRLEQAGDGQQAQQPPQPPAESAAVPEPAVVGSVGKGNGRDR